MTNQTPTIERMSVQTDAYTTHYEVDHDLFIKLRRGGVITSGECQAMLVVKIEIDDNPASEVLFDKYLYAGTTLEVIDKAIDQLTIVREQLERIEQVEAHASGLVEASMAVQA